MRLVASMQDDFEQAEMSKNLLFNRTAQQILGGGSTINKQAIVSSASAGFLDLPGLLCSHLSLGLHFADSH